MVDQRDRRRHAMFAGINASLYTCLAGITPEAPGYAAVRIEPSVPAALTSVSGRLETVQGSVAVDWHQDADAFDLTVALPDHVDATISLPLFGGGTNRVVHQGAGIGPGSSAANRFATRVAGGPHHFTVSKR